MFELASRSIDGSNEAIKGHNNDVSKRKIYVPLLTEVEALEPSSIPLTTVDVQVYQR